jgi:hypothetical protein
MEGSSSSNAPFPKDSEIVQFRRVSQPKAEEKLPPKEVYTKRTLYSDGEVKDSEIVLNLSKEAPDTEKGSYLSAMTFWQRFVIEKKEKKEPDPIDWDFNRDEFLLLEPKILRHYLVSIHGKVKIGRPSATGFMLDKPLISLPEPEVEVLDPPVTPTGRGRGRGRGRGGSRGRGSGRGNFFFNPAESEEALKLLRRIAKATETAVERIEENNEQMFDYFRANATKPATPPLSDHDDAPVDTPKSEAAKAEDAEPQEPPTKKQKVEKDGKEAVAA